MRTFGSLASALMVLISFADAAQAACRGRQSRFYFHNPGPYTTHYELTDGSTHCVVSYTAGGTSTFHSMKVLAPPKHGRLGPHGEYSTVSFRYIAKPGFKGNDSFVMQVCGEDRLGKGCARLDYTVEVK